MSSLYEVLQAHSKNKKDKRVFGLVLQGGGMRAVYSAAATATLIEYGLTDAFEHVVGSSAGAINGAYFLTGYPEGWRAYTDALTNKNFINLTRLDRVVDIDYLVDWVLKHKYPLDITKLLKSRSKLHIILTNARNGHEVVMSNHHKFAEIYEELRASSALPLLYKKRVRVGGKYYIDGGVADLVPIDVAIRKGCTDIVVVMTQPLSSYHFGQKLTWLRNHLIKFLAQDQSDLVRKLLPTDDRVLQINLHRLLLPDKKIRLYVLEPSDPAALIAPYEVDRPKVAELARLGVSDTDVFLHRPLKEMT